MLGLIVIGISIVYSIVLFKGLEESVEVIAYED